MIELQSQVTRALTLLGEAAREAARQCNEGVPLATAMAPFEQRLREYSEIARNFDAQSTCYVNEMARTINQLVSVMPGLETVRIAVEEFKKEPQLSQAVDAATKHVNKNYFLRLCFDIWNFKIFIVILSYFFFSWRKKKASFSRKRKQQQMIMRRKGRMRTILQPSSQPRTPCTTQQSGN